MIIKALHQVGEYMLLMKKCITIPDRWSMFFKQLIKEIYKLGVDSLWIVIIISIFIGTVIAIQISLNITSPLIPKFTIGYTTREIILLEFSSSIMALILAGKVGSNIASEIGTMRVTEQIDAMEIMGVNSANFLIPGAASLMLSKGYRRAVPLFAFGLHAAGFVMSFILPYVSVSASEGLSVAVTLLKILSAATLTCLIFLPSILKKPLPSLLRTFCGGVAAVNVVSSVFIAPTSEVLLYPPIWLYFALTVISFLTVISIIANTERENAYITANLNSEVERQVKDIRAVVTESDKHLQINSHDLKKPLVFGENHLDILLERERDDEQIKLINIVRQNNKKVLENLKTL